MIPFIIAVISVVCLYQAWAIGANDVANSMGVAVGSKSLSLVQAIMLAAIFEFAGCILAGSDVTDTVRKGIVEPMRFEFCPERFVIGMSCAVLACALWIHLATWLGLPVSSTHSIVGAVAGFGVMACGWGSVKWSAMLGIVTAWFLSPIVGLALGYMIFRMLLRSVLGRPDPLDALVKACPVIVFLSVGLVTLGTIYNGLGSLAAKLPWLASGIGACVTSVAAALAAAAASRPIIVRYVRRAPGAPLSEQLHRAERASAPLLVLSSCAVAFAHGANDVANAVGPLAGVIQVLRSGRIEVCAQVPLWILALGGVGIVVGLATYGRAVIRTIGGSITEITPSRALAANMATALTVLLCTRLKLPVSTSHTIVGAVMGVGLARGLAAVNGAVLKRIFVSWALTVPAAAALTAALMLVCRLAGAAQWLRGVMAAAG